MKRDLQAIMDAQGNAVSKKFAVTEEIFHRFGQAVNREWRHTVSIEGGGVKAFFDMSKMYTVLVSYENDRVKWIAIKEKEETTSMAEVLFSRPACALSVTKVTIDCHTSNKAIKKYIFDIATYVINEMEDLDNEN